MRKVPKAVPSTPRWTHMHAPKGPMAISHQALGAARSIRRGKARDSPIALAYTYSLNKPIYGHTTPHRTRTGTGGKQMIRVGNWLVWTSRPSYHLPWNENTVYAFPCPPPPKPSLWTQRCPDILLSEEIYEACATLIFDEVRETQEDFNREGFHIAIMTDVMEEAAKAAMAVMREHVRFGVFDSRGRFIPVQGCAERPADWRMRASDFQAHADQHRAKARDTDKSSPDTEEESQSTETGSDATSASSQITDAYE